MKWVTPYSQWFSEQEARPFWMMNLGPPWPKSSPLSSALKFAFADLESDVQQIGSREKLGNPYFYWWRYGFSGKMSGQRMLGDSNVFRCCLFSYETTRGLIDDGQDIWDEARSHRHRHREWRCDGDSSSDKAAESGGLASCPEPSWEAGALGSRNRLRGAAEMPAVPSPIHSTNSKFNHRTAYSEDMLSGGTIYHRCFGALGHFKAEGHHETWKVWTFVFVVSTRLFQVHDTKGVCQVIEPWSPTKHGLE